MAQRRARRGNPKLAVAYLRASKDEQRLSPEAQSAAIEGWADKGDTSVVGWHSDHGLGGGLELEDRPGLVAALGQLRAARAGVLVVAKRDRLARDVAVVATIERDVHASGARVIAADGVGNGASDADQFLRRILDAAAEYERALIRERTKAALAAKRARGERVGSVPFGYVAIDGGRLVPNEGEQAVITAVRKLRRSGASLRRIVTECAERQLTSRAGTPLSLVQVDRILRATQAARPNPEVTHVTRA
jgi:DNA invertase Pin-like site-specific DNA recombinase